MELPESKEENQVLVVDIRAVSVKKTWSKTMLAIRKDVMCRAKIAQPFKNVMVRRFAHKREK